MGSKNVKRAMAPSTVQVLRESLTTKTSDQRLVVQGDSPYRTHCKRRCEPRQQQMAL